MPTTTNTNPVDDHTLAQRVLDHAGFITLRGVHLFCFAAIWTGVSWKSLSLALALYLIRMHIITGWYHRYFSHRSFTTGRSLQFIMGFLGCACIQKGPVWWASKHRKHHKESDLPGDVHSPLRYGPGFWNLVRGLWYAQVGWLKVPENSRTDWDRVSDLAKFPELRALEWLHPVPPLLLTFLCYYIDGWTGVVVGMGWSTVVFWHATFSINSLAHVWGSQRYATGDESRNNLWLAILTLGEGWHNNHHHREGRVRQGERWWEVDVTYYLLWLMSLLRLVRLRPALHVVSRQ